MEIKPEYLDALFNWGNAVYNQAEIKLESGKNEDADRLIKKSEEKYKEANVIMPGSGLYNLACQASLRGDFDACQDLLFQCKKAGWLPSRERMKGDKELDPVRDKDWYDDLFTKD